MPFIITSNELLCCLYKVLSLFKEHINDLLRFVIIHSPLLGKDTG